jgi:polygalacturonase
MKSIVIKLSLLALLVFLYSCNSQKAGNGFITERQANENINKIIEAIQEPEIPSDTIDLIKFSGHSPDENGSINFRPWIEAALDSLDKMGGGWLLMPNTQKITSWLRYTETYRIEGPIELRSNTGLILDRSVRLFFPFNPDSFLKEGKGVLTRYEGTTIYSFSPLIRAFNKENVAIVSRGKSGGMPEIDGDGEKWQKWMWDGEQERVRKGLKASYQLLKDINNADVPIAERVYTDPENDFFRPETMEFFLCKNVLVEGIKIVNSPFWCVKPVFSESCTFRDMRFDAMAVNNDGIDPESSKNILIENIMFGNHDDNIAIKAGRDKEGRDGALVAGTELENIESEYINNGRITGAAEEIVIRNCHFYGHHAICIGSEMSGGVRNVYAVDNYCVKEVNMGLFIKSSRLRGGTVENIYIRNLKINRTKSEVIAIVPNYDKADDSPYPPLFKNIQIENLECDSSQQGILIHGWSDKPVENVYLKNVVLNRVVEDELIVEQSKNIVFENLIVNGENYNETLDKTDEDETPPDKI